MAEPEWMKKLKFGTSTKKDLKEPKRGDFPKGSTGQSQYNLAWAKWDRTSGNTAVRKKTAKLQDLNTDISRSREDISRFDAALDPTNIQKLSLMRRNQITGYRDAAEANLLETRSKLSAADPTNFGLAVDAANDYSGLGGAFDGKLGYNLQGLKINFDYDDPNKAAASIDANTAYNPENQAKFGYNVPDNLATNSDVTSTESTNKSDNTIKKNNNTGKNEGDTSNKEKKSSDGMKTRWIPSVMDVEDGVTNYKDSEEYRRKLARDAFKRKKELSINKNKK